MALQNPWHDGYDYKPDYLYVMPFHVKQPLCTILDNTDDVKHNWQVLVKAVKKYPISGSALNEIHRHSNPASVILDHYGSNLMTVDELYSYLASIHNNEACQELLSYCKWTRFVDYNLSRSMILLFYSIYMLIVFNTKRNITVTLQFQFSINVNSSRYLE